MHKLIVGLAVVAVAIFVVAAGVAVVKQPKQPTPALAPPASTDLTDPTRPPPVSKPDPTTDATAKPDKPVGGDTTPVPKPEPAEAVIEPVAIDGADVADSLKLEMYKFAFAVPQGQYTVHVWLERWTRGATEPTSTVLIEQNGVFAAGTILVQFPTATWPQGLVKVGSWEVRMDEPLKIGTPMSIRSLKTTVPIVDGGDLHLVSYAYSENGRPAAGLRQVHTQNDVTIYLKARLTPGPFKPFAEPAEEAPTEPPAPPAPPASPTPAPQVGDAPRASP